MGSAYNYRRSRQKDMQGKAGRLYEHMICEMLDLEHSPKGSEEYADCFSIDLAARFEVKSRGDANSFEIRVNQVHEYQENTPFPLDHTAYALFPYQATEPLHRGDPRPRGIGPNTHSLSLMRGIRKDADRNRFWAEHVQTSYILDFQVICALEAHLGTHPCRMIGRSDEEAIRLTRTTLDELFGEETALAPTLRKLGLKSAGWAKGVYPIRVRFQIDDQRLASGEFTLITILRKGFNAKIADKLAYKALTLE
ncbi:MAG: hypothetical protein JWN50_9 [Parcubacteria group bacterium]|nr:hypothetical protein [Parcubacteria group bacterium]